MADTKNDKNSNSPASTSAPALRFPGFTAPWRRMPLSQIAPLQRGFDLPTDKVSAGKFPIVYSNGILRYHNEYKCTAPGVVTGRSGTIGKFTYIPTGYYWPHNTSLWVTDFCGNHPLFIYYLYQSINIEQFATGSGVPTLNRNDVHRHTTIIPNPDEQLKIANLLSLIDERIATQKRIIDKLETLILGLRENLFKNMSGYQVFLSDIAEIYQPQTISSTKLSDKGFPVYGANGIIGYYDSYNHETEQICITCRGNTCGTVNFSSTKSWITGNAMVVNTDSHIDIVCKRFLFHYLSNYNFKSVISGSGQPQIVRSALIKIKIMLPTLDKQIQVAKFFDSILHKTNVAYRELELLQKQKQYLLCQLFI